MNKVLDSGFLEGSLTRLGKTERREEFLFLFLLSLHFLLRHSSPSERREHAYLLETVRFIATVIKGLSKLLLAGIYKNDGPFDVMIDINQIEELHNVPSNTKVMLKN